MRRKEITLILTLVLLIIILFSYLYIFNIYEVEIKITPDQLFADNQSTVTINAVPINSFGKMAPFRKVSAEFNITSGKDLVTIVKQDNSVGELILKAKNKTGKVEVIIKTEKSLLPSIVEIPVNPNFASAVNTKND